LAIFAIKVYDVFLKYKDEYDETGREAPDFEIAEAVMEAMKKFEASIYKYNKRAKKQDERNDK
jgi:hypothetical protein